MNEKAAALACVAAASAALLAAASCGRSAAPSAPPGREASGSAPVTSTERLAETMAGVVGVVFTGPPPTPATPSDCIRRWNSSANAAARRTAAEADAAPLSALVRIGKTTDYFGGAGRCVIWIAARHEPTTAIVFVERAPCVFMNAGGASRVLVTPDLAVDDQGRIAA